MSIVVLELQDVGSARDGGTSDYPPGVVSHDLDRNGSPSIPQTLSTSGAIQVGAKCKFVRVTSRFTAASGKVAYFRVSPKWINDTADAYGAGPNYHRLPPGSERTLQVHGSAVIHFAITDHASEGVPVGLLLALTQT